MKMTLAWIEQKLSKTFDYFANHLALTLVILFILSLAVRLYFTPFDIIPREDGYGYILKSLEIAEGNFVPTKTQSIGWALFMSPFFYLFGSTSIFQNMAYARILSVFVGSLIIFPLAYIGKKLLDKRSLIVLLVLFTFYHNLITDATTAKTEPLFTFLLLTCIYFIIKTKENQNYILAASVFGALVYYVRPNGILLLPIILASFYLLKKHIADFKYRYLIYILLVFFIVSAPMLYQRYEYFGSPFSYGEVSKYFVDNRDKIHSDNIPVPSLMDYLRTHTFQDYIDRFLIHGLFGIIHDYIFFIISPLLLLFFLYGIIRYLTDCRFIPLIVVFIIWIMGFVPLYSINIQSRFFNPTIPFVLIFSVIAIKDILKDNKHKNILLSLLLIIFILFSVMSQIRLVQSYSSVKNYQTGLLELGKWTADNVKGKIAIAEGGDLIMLHLPDTTIGGVELLNLYAPKSNLSVLRPGYFEDLSSGMDWLREINATHLVLDELTMNTKRPYLKEIHSGKEIPSYLTEIYRNKDSKLKAWLYYINWTEYGNQGVN